MANLQANIAIKNQMLPTNASMSLGLGDQLQSQVEDELAQRRKKLRQKATQGLPELGPATQSLFAQSGGMGGL